MNFLIQTINGSIQHDFSFELQQAKQYYDWIGEDMNLSYIDYSDIENIEDPDKYVPIGSVEFVSKYLYTFYKDKVKSLEPLNVPTELFPFTGRKISNIYTQNDIKNEKFDKTFRKSLYTIKHKSNGIIHTFNIEDILNFQISEVIDILSEWRVFIFKGKIQHISNYSGDCMVFPNPNEIEKMVKAYSSAPKAWTLDVAVTPKNETVVIECHRFFSCGLYGFSDHAIIPKMFSQEWYEMKTIQ